ncbi:MAG: TetR family transcriptional regulator C-terminal domain-containing protein [Thermoflexales bacterium]|nr:TetR family transcriptional regulator C-terminal domain-containing protein [Thermoflexales bacterium]
MARLRAARELPGTAIERLIAYYEALIAEEQVLPLMHVLHEFYALGLRREDMRAVIVDFIGQLTGLLEAIIQEGIEIGEFAPADARQAARVLDALLSGTFLHWVYAPEEVNVNAQLCYGVRLVFRGLVAPS